MRVSVILPLYNGAAHIEAAVLSILDQRFRDFELIIIDDASVDDGASIIQKFRDSRLRLIRLAKNQGLIGVLNIGLQEARGELIARMDQDDIAFPQRLLQQVKFMDEQPNTLVCGTAVSGIGAKRRRHIFPTSNADILAVLPVTSPIAHPTVMMRASPIRRIGYSIDAENAEDYQLWWDAGRCGELRNIAEPLLFYRHHNKQMSTINADAQTIKMAQISASGLAGLGLLTSDGERELHINALTFAVAKDMEYAGRVGNWLRHLRESFPPSRVVDDIYCKVWRRYCLRQTHLGAPIMEIFSTAGPKQPSDTGVSRGMLLAALYLNLSPTAAPIRWIRNLVRR